MGGNADFGEEREKQQAEKPSPIVEDTHAADYMTANSIYVAKQRFNVATSLEAAHHEDEWNSGLWKRMRGGFGGGTGLVSGDIALIVLAVALVVGAFVLASLQ